jgi:hypothetical protein
MSDKLEVLVKTKNERCVLTYKNIIEYKQYVGNKYSSAQGFV